MKPVMLLMLTASLMLAAPQAFAQQQDACSNRYGACMDHCSGRPASLQEQCAKTCESNSDQCYVGLYGPSAPAMNNDTAATTQPVAPAARDAQGSAAPEKPAKPEKH